MINPDETDHGRNHLTDSRRGVLTLLGALGVTGLAGCGGDGDEDTPTNTDAGGNGNVEATVVGTYDCPDVRDTAEVSIPVSLSTFTPADIPEGIPQESLEAYFAFDGTAGTNGVTGVGGNDQPGGATGTPTKNVSGVSSATNNAWEFTTSGDTPDSRDSVADGFASGPPRPERTGSDGGRPVQVHRPRSVRKAVPGESGPG